MTTKSTRMSSIELDSIKSKNVDSNLILPKIKPNSNISGNEYKDGGNFGIRKSMQPLSNAKPVEPASPDRDAYNSSQTLKTPAALYQNTSVA